MDIKIIQDEEGRFAAHDMETGVTYMQVDQHIAYEVVKNYINTKKMKKMGFY